jgi:hypothetical protein
VGNNPRPCAHRGAVWEGVVEEVKSDYVIARLEARLLALEWKPITTASIVTLAHEVLRDGRTVSISPLLAAPSSSALLNEGYTHYRLINAPKVEVVQ